MTAPRQQTETEQSCIYRCLCVLKLSSNSEVFSSRKSLRTDEDGQYEIASLKTWQLHEKPKAKRQRRKEEESGLHIAYCGRLPPWKETTGEVDKGVGLRCWRSLPWRDRCGSVWPSYLQAAATGSCAQDPFQRGGCVWRRLEQPAACIARSCTPASSEYCPLPQTVPSF